MKMWPQSEPLMTKLDPQKLASFICKKNKALEDPASEKPTPVSALTVLLKESSAHAEMRFKKF